MLLPHIQAQALTLYLLELPLLDTVRIAGDADILVYYSRPCTVRSLLPLLAEYDTLLPSLLELPQDI